MCSWDDVEEDIGLDEWQRAVESEWIDYTHKCKCDDEDECTCMTLAQFERHKLEELQSYWEWREEEENYEQENV